MDVKEWLKNYRKNEVKISMAEATGKVNKEIESLACEKKMIDIAIELLMPEQQIAIDEHYRKGKAYERTAKMLGYTKATIKKRAEKGIEIMQEVMA